MRHLILAALAVSLAGCSSARSRPSVAAVMDSPLLSCGSGQAATALWLVDGRESSCKDVNQIPSARIANIETSRVRRQSPSMAREPRTA